MAIARTILNHGNLLRIVKPDKNEVQFKLPICQNLLSVHQEG